jgi:streptogramin lyase
MNRPHVFFYSIILVLSAGCSHRSQPVMPNASSPQMTMPQSVSPGSIKPPPMAKTAILPASTMNVRPQTAVQPASFTQLPGSASFVTVSPADGSVWALSDQPTNSADKYIWQYTCGIWTNISGLAKRLAAGSDGTLYAVNSAGGIYSYSSGQWTSMAGGASDITVTSGGQLIALSNGRAAGSDQAIWIYTQGTWQQANGAGVRVAASLDTNTYNIPEGTIAARGVYVLNSAGNIYYGSQSNFVQIGGAASDAAPTSTGGLFVLGSPSNSSGNAIYYYDLDHPGWTVQPGSGVSIATDSTRFYVVGSSGGIYLSPIVATSGTIVEYPLTDNCAAPSGITAGPDGNVWFTEYHQNPNSNARVGKITTSGAVTEYAIPIATALITDIAAGADGNLWFTESGANNIGKITTSGTVTTYAVGSHPSGIAKGPDGNMWFTETSSNQIGVITPAGAVTQWASQNSPTRITAGQDGALWFTENSFTNSRIGRIATNGTQAEYTVPTAGVEPYYITMGSDTNLWFTEANGNNIGKVGTAGMLGVITEYAVPSSTCTGSPGHSDPPPQSASCGTTGIVTGSDGNMWFGENSGKIGRITPSGVVTEYSISKTKASPLGLALGPDGKIWFADSGTSAIGKLP